MKREFNIVRFTAFLFLGLAVSSCLEQGNFPDTPTISLNKVVFVDTPDSPDTLAISIDFQDGDGDLGLDSQNEIFYPYNNKFYFSWFEPIQQAVKFTVYFTIKGTVETAYVHAYFNSQLDRDAFKNQYLSGIATTQKALPDEPYILYFLLSSNKYEEVFFNNIITFDSRSTIAALDTLPDFVHPYNCTNYELNEDTGLTLYYQKNLYHNNIIVRFYVEENGFFREFDWETIYRYPQCNTTFDGRFPIMNDSGREKPLEGTIKYNMASLGFNPLFSIKRLKLQVEIIDRSLNRSNLIETPPFRLEDIKK